jgi:hypothetical protein
MRKKEKSKERKKTRGGGGRLENLRSATSCTLRMYACLNSLQCRNKSLAQCVCPVTVYQFAVVNVFRRR